MHESASQNHRVGHAGRRSGDTNTRLLRLKGHAVCVGRRRVGPGRRAHLLGVVLAGRVDGHKHHLARGQPQRPGWRRVNRDRVIRETHQDTGPR